MRTIRTVLFDLDGTLLDTAPDLADALNAVLMENHRPPRSFEEIRGVVSGSSALRAVATVSSGASLMAFHFADGGGGLIARASS